MSSDKRLLLCVILSSVCFLGLRSVMVQTGLIKEPPQKVANNPAAKANPAIRDKALAQGEPNPAMADGLPVDPFLAEAAPPPVPTPTPAALAPTPKVAPRVALARPDELILGAVDPNDAKSPYKLRLQLDQNDASVLEVTSSRYDAEFNQLARNQKPGRLPLIQPNKAAPDAPGSLAVFLSPVVRGGRPAPEGDAEPGVASLATRLERPIDTWEVVREKAELPAVQPVTKTDPASRAVIQGQEIRFRTKLTDPAVEVTKVFRIWEGEDGFEFDLRFNSPQNDAKLYYRLIGPHGIPIEGEWYTTTFRDVFFNQIKPGSTELLNRTGNDAHKYAGDPTQRITKYPLGYAGVEDQYFATFVQPTPTPRTDEDRWDAAADSLVIHAKADDPQKADIAVMIDSKPIPLGPNLGEVVHSYRVFAGPKTASALAPYNAEELASYRKTWITIPFASSLATNIIAPLLGRIYRVTESISRAFGASKGNYGIAIILLTMTVRLIMFPIGRKQAMMAKKMQDLQPVLAEVKEKFKDDKEALTRETMAVWKQNKVNPAAGCLPALIQMPIFVGLWQSLNNSVELRHSSFLYIRDLAAPDMLFRFPVDLPIVGQYFNVLPFLVVALMLIQTKLFSPPPTTPEAEAQQKMMKYMMVFMAFMFYKVPSGLGLYFITSSLWQIGERLLLPKIMKTPQVNIVPASAAPDKERGTGLSRGQALGNGNGNANPNGGAQGWLGKRLEKLLDEAAKDKTIRNLGRDEGRGRNGNGSPGSGGNGTTNGDGNRPRSKPPGKRR